MKVIVLGAGIAGLTTAWYLAAGGAEVTVVERNEAPASETSHANGGHMSTQSGTPWMGPEGVRDFLTSRFTHERTIRVSRAHDPGRWGWFARALAASRPAAYRRATATLASLARYSSDAFEALCEEQALDVHLERRGRLSLYQSKRAFARACKHRERGIEVWSPHDALAHEPALANAVARFVGGLYYPDDATGDCLRFCVELADRAAEAGVQFRYGQTAERLVIERGGCKGVVTAAGKVRGDACVVAMGSESAGFLRPTGVRLPVLPLRGYTLTALIEDAAEAPGGFSDAERHLVFSRLGDRFRAAGMADFAGGESKPERSRAEQLERLVREWYPALSRTGVKHWSCLRPMSPDGPPILGASGIPGVWLNTGLGPLGWTLGCGAGRIVADLVLGNRPALAVEGLTLDRFHARRRQHGAYRV